MIHMQKRVGGCAEHAVDEGYVLDVDAEFGKRFEECKFGHVEMEIAGEPVGGFLVDDFRQARGRENHQQHNTDARHQETEDRSEGYKCDFKAFAHGFTA